MRTIFSVRFLAAIGATVGLFFLLLSVLGESSNSSATTETSVVVGGSVVTVPSTTEPDEPTPIRRIDLVDVIVRSEPGPVPVVDGVATEATNLRLDNQRVVRIEVGTPGENYCVGIRTVNGCAVVADLLGDAVVWFAIVPANVAAGTVELPAIDVLEEGQAILVNGWSLPYAPILARRCVADDDPSTLDEFDSYREFRDQLGDDFVATYEVDERRLTAVTCRKQVAWLQDA